MFSKYTLRPGIESQATGPVIQFCEARGIPYTHFGEKPPEVVVINGGQGFVRQQTPRRQRRDCRRIARILPADTSFVLLGYPDAVPGATLEILAERMAELVARRFGPIILVGISFGGILALRLASRNAALVRRLILVSSAHELGETGRGLVRQQVSHVLAQDYVALMESFTTVFRRPWRNALLRAALWLGRKRLAQHMGNTQTIVRYLNALLECSGERADWLNSIEAQTLVIGGEDDQFFGEGAMKRTADRIAGSTLHLIEGEQHMMMVECSGIVARAIANWLADAQGAPSIKAKDGVEP